MTSPVGAPKSSGDPSFSDSLDIGRAMAKGTGWTVGAQLAIQAIGMLSTIILARLLVPADFGLVALATALAGALQAVSEFSFDQALIHNQSAGRREYDTAWTLSICRNAILAAMLAVGAGLITSSFGDERLEPVVYWRELSSTDFRTLQSSISARNWRSIEIWCLWSSASLAQPLSWCRSLLSGAITGRWWRA